MKRSHFLPLLAGAAAGVGGWGLCARVARAQGPVRMAVTADVQMGEDAADTLSMAQAQRLVDRLTGVLLRTGRFRFVDRERIDQVIHEQGFSNSAYADPKTAAALGKIIGASTLLHLTLEMESSARAADFVDKYQVRISASYSVVKTDTAEITASGSADGDGQGEAPHGASPLERAPIMRDALNACADDLAAQLSA